MPREKNVTEKIARIFDQAAGEKKTCKRRFLTWSGSACALILILSAVCGFLYTKFPSAPLSDAPQGKITFPPTGSKTDRQFTIESFTKNILIERPTMGLAAIYAAVGHGKEARAEAEEVYRLNPKFSLDYIAKTFPFKKETEKKFFIDSLRKAGLK